MEFLVGDVHRRANTRKYAAGSKTKSAYERPSDRIGDSSYIGALREKYQTPNGQGSAHRNRIADHLVIASARKYNAHCSHRKE
jgi:hypothetical protein